MEFLFVYVREAHPGKTCLRTSRWTTSLRAAQNLRDEEELKMPVLVDDLRGPSIENMASCRIRLLLIDLSGRIAFRCQFTSPEARAQNAIDELLGCANNAPDKTGPWWRVVKISGRRNHSRCFILSDIKRGGERPSSTLRKPWACRGNSAVARSPYREQPVVEHPADGGSRGADGWVCSPAGSIFAGVKLRQKRLRDTNPEIATALPVNSAPRGTGTDDYEPFAVSTS